MARPTKPFTVAAKPGCQRWHIKAEWDESYILSDVPLKRDKAGKPANRAEAERAALQRYLDGERTHLADVAPTYTRLLRDAWLLDKDPRLKSMFAVWDGQGRPPVSFDTIKSSRARLEAHVLNDPHIMSAKLSDRAKPWEQWRDRRRAEGVLPRTINECLKNVTTYLNYLEAVGDIGSVPTRAQAVPRIRTESRPTGIFSHDEIFTLANELSLYRYSVTREGVTYDRGQQSRTLQRSNRALVVLLLATLARPVEIFRLRWRDVDINTPGAEVVKLPLTKTGKPRTVPLAPFAAAALAEHQEASIRIDRNEFVFCAESTGKPRTITYLRGVVHRAMDAAAMPTLDDEGGTRTPYTLKHSMLSAALEHGAHPHGLAALAGHSLGALGSDFSLTAAQRHYAKLRIEHLRESLVPIIENVLTGAHVSIGA